MIRNVPVNAMTVADAELIFHQTLESFSNKAACSYDDARNESLKLYAATKHLLTSYRNEHIEESTTLLYFLIETINKTLHIDRYARQTLRYSSQWNQPQIRHVLFKIYEILFCFYGFKFSLQIKSSLFYCNDSPIYIFPGQPRHDQWQFVYGEFAFLDNTVAKHRLPLRYVQHVVHDVDNLFAILQTITGKAEFKGHFNEDFNGPPLCWFAPLPPPWLNGSTPPCDSLDPTGSRYGCYRFIIPFDILLQRFPKSFILGTRKYKQEHSHTILLTKQTVEYLMLNKKRQAIKLTDTDFIKHSGAGSILEWLCFHDDGWTKWDQLEFAIATERLQLDPTKDEIRLDFISHTCKKCVPTSKGGKKCKYQWDNKTAMKHFLTKLNEESIDLNKFKAFFLEDVWNHLLATN